MNSPKAIKNLYRLALMAVLAFVAVSCSTKNEELLASVPDDVDFVASVNLIDLAKESGVTFEDGRMILPREYTYIKDNLPENFTKDAGKLAEAVDLKNIVIFGSLRKETAYVTASVLDIENLRSFLKKSGMERDKEAGYEIYATSESDYAECVVISDDEKQAWFMEGRKYVKNVDDFEHARKKNNILRYSGIADALTKDNIFNVAFDQNSVNPLAEEYWGIISGNIKNNAFVLDATAIKTDGESIPVSSLTEISTDFLRYMPANFLGVIAFGLKGEGEWTDQFETGLKLGGLDAASAKEIMSYIRSLDGTVAIGFGPKNKSALFGGNINGWQAIAMVHMSQNKVNDLISLFNNLFQSQGVAPASAGNGLYQIDMDGSMVTYGMLDGYFAIGFNIGLAPDKNNSFTSDFTGKKLAAAFQTPLLSETLDAPKLTYSIKAYTELNGNTIRTQVRLVGTDKPIIPTLVGDFPAMTEAINRAFASNRALASEEVSVEEVEADDIFAD